MEMTRGKREVTIVEILDKIGSDLGRSYRWVVMQNLRNCGVKMMTKTKCLEIMEGGVLIMKDGKREILEADSVVIATGYRECNNLYLELKGKVDQLLVVGDAHSPRKCLEAVYEGARAGREI
jgi:2,4-dienoyl-CoA reductase (NADPH2)